jgi:hypothetical protein
MRAEQKPKGEKQMTEKETFEKKKKDYADRMNERLGRK